MAARPNREPTATTLAGREREQAALRTALDAALAGRGRLVLIGGEAGIGKTTLAEALLSEAERQGALVLVGRCYDLSETPPYGPWTEALARVPRDGASPPPPTPGGGAGAPASQVALFAAVRDFLAAETAQRPLVLLLEDLHWADPASLDLLRFLARGLGDLPLLLLATYRGDELTRHHPLYQILPLLVRESRAERIDLRPLDRSGLLTLVGTRYGLPTEAKTRLVDYLVGRAEGNPFFTGEVLREVEEARALARSDSGWQLGDLALVGVPPLLRQVIDARIDRLGEEARDLLELAAVLGQEVPLRRWATVAGVAEGTLQATIERAVAARLLDDPGAGVSVRFRHALTREALYEGLGGMRRRMLHGRAGEVLAAQPDPDPDAVAYHFQQAGDERAATWLTRAGHRARHAFANRTAAARFEAALALTAAQGVGASERSWLLYFLAWARYYDDPHSGIPLLEEAVRLATRSGDRALAADARYQIGFHLTGTGNHRRGLDEMVAGVAILEELDATELVRHANLLETQSQAAIVRRYEGTLALRLANVGRYEEARRLAHRAAAQNDSLNADFTLAQIHAAFGQVAEASQAIERGLTSIRGDGDLMSLVLYLMYMLHTVVVPYQVDRLEERERFVTEATQATARVSEAQAELPPQLGRLPLLMLEGHWAKARTTALAYRDSHRHTRHVGAGFLASLAQAQGDSAAAMAIIREWLPAGASEEPGGAHYQHSFGLQRLAATLATEAGDLTAARAWLEAHDRWLAWSGSEHGKAEGALAWSAYHRSAGDLSQAYEHAERALARATEPRQPLVLLATHRLLGELDTTANRHNEARAHLDVALTLADACAAPYERALCLLALAELHEGEGKQDEATAALADARTILAPLGAAPALLRADTLLARLAASPPAVQVDTAPFALTVREVEVLRLVAQGLTDIQVAEQLYVSANTVKTHLRSIYNKLNVPSRTAATRLAIEHSIA